METYIWNLCKESIKHSDDQFSMRFGDNIKFVQPPASSPLRKITLSYVGLQFIQQWDGSAWVADRIGSPNINAYLLDDFYMRHRLHQRFIYPSPLYGDVVVRFAQPLEWPEGTTNGNGWVEGVKVELEESPW